MKQKLLLCFVFFSAISLVAVGQNRNISGKVLDDLDEGLPGVSVFIKGTSSGTVTDINGKFTLSATNDATLVFQAVGFTTQEVLVGTQSTIDLSMKVATTELNELVVTALGIERTKNELPYAAQTIKGEAISATRDGNVVNTLSGKIAGVDIKRNNTMGGSTNITIRGAKSLTGNNQALFVVDGVPIDNSNTNTDDQTIGRGGYDYGNAAADINPDDIASINVLKGAAATALYGSRASNGVVMITTKKGSKKKGIGVTVNSGVTFGFIDKSTFVEYQDEYGAGYGSFYEDPTGKFLYRDIDGDGQKDLVTPLSEDASYGAAFDPGTMVHQWNSFDPTSPTYGQATPWVAGENDPTTFFETSVMNSHNIAIDGTNDKGFFKVSYTKNTEKGILPNSKLTKDFINFAASYKVSDKLTATGAINTSYITGKGRYGTGYDDKNLMGGFRQWWQTNVDIKELEEAYFRNNQNISWNWADPGNLTPIYWDNPYWTRYENYQNDNRLRYFGYAMINYQLTDWLSVMGRVSLDSYSELQEERLAVGSKSPSEYKRFNRTFRENNYDLMVNINKKLNESFTLKGIVGGNIRRTLIESVLSETNGGLAVPGFYAITNSVNTIEPPIEKSSELEVDGIFASATLGYKDLLFLDLTGRRDVSSTLPKGNNAYFYPSVSLSFVFSELMQNVSWLTGAKFRANYAEVGNTAPVYSTDDYYDKPTPFGAASGTRALFSIYRTKANPDLEPEKTKSYEAGLEMNFLDGRVGFDLTYYKQNTTNQIWPASISRATGYDSKYINAGDVQNQGVELSIFATPVKTDNFAWKVNVNWARNRNLVKELIPGIDNLQLGSFQGGVSINAALNEPYGTIRGSNFVYKDGQRMINSDGFYAESATSNEVIGDANPDWIGGINNKLSYKGVSLSFLIDIRQGGDIFSLDQYYGLATGISKMTTFTNDLGNPVRNTLANGGGVILDGVKEDGTLNDIRVSAENFGLFGYSKNPAAAFIYDASYVKLREVTLTYSLPTALLSKLGFIQGVDVSVIGRNLWIIHKNLPYADPEDTISSGNLQGYMGGSYPTTRTVGFNVRLKF